AAGGRHRRFPHRLGRTQRTTPTITNGAKTTMSATTEDIVLAAIGSIEPKSAEESDRDYQMRVSQQAVALSIMTGDNSPVSKAVERIQNCKVFAATVEGLNKEKSSTRGIVKLLTKPSKWNDGGKEKVRTERTDNPEGMA